MNKLQKAYTNKTRRSPRHGFIFKVDGQKPATVWATVKPAKSEVVIVLTADDVQRAIDLKGFGNAQNCAGAVCTKRHADRFGHAVTGHVDWLYDRAYVADKNDNLGFPKSCVAYDHGDKIARLFDTKDGLKQLLRLLQKNGPREIRLFPVVYRKRGVNAPKGQKGAPRRRKLGVRGHKLRMTMVRASMPDFAA